jgi:histidinol-phosphate aminotransferase
VETENFAIRPQAVLDAVDNQTSMVFLATPNNPTGFLMPREKLLALARALNERRVLLVVDYAYMEYVAPGLLPPPTELIASCSNVIVLRTFSKAYGLAGFRVGYVQAHERIIEYLEKARQPFNVGSAALEAALAACDDTDFLKKSVQLNQDEISKLKAGLEGLGLRDIPSHGNFLLVDLGRPADAIYRKLLSKGVIVRPVANYGLPNHLRISVGLPDENAIFLESFSQIWREI